MRKNNLGSATTPPNLSSKKMLSIQMNESIFFQSNGKKYNVNKYHFKDQKRLLSFFEGSSHVISFEVDDAFINTTDIESIFPTGLYCKRGDDKLCFKLEVNTKGKQVIKYYWNGYTLRQVSHRCKYRSGRFHEANLLLNIRSGNGRKAFL